MQDILCHRARMRADRNIPCGFDYKVLFGVSYFIDNIQEIANQPKTVSNPDFFKNAAVGLFYFGAGWSNDGCLEMVTIRGSVPSKATFPTMIKCHPVVPGGGTAVAYPKYKSL